MDNKLKVAGGVGLGAGLLFLLDPAGGKRRLRQVRDRVTTLAGDYAGAEASETTPIEEGVDPRFEAADWTPAARLLVSAAGGGLALYGATRRGRIGAAIGSLGVGLLVRGLSDVAFRTLRRRGRADEPREVRRAIHVGAAPAEVFALWVDYDNFPRLFARVRQVRDAGDGRSHWMVDGPAGMPVEWDAVLTRFETERELAWRTAGDPEQAQQLQVLFTPDAEGGTRVEVQLSPASGGGPSGEEFAAVFGSDPERQIGDDLVRMKALVQESAPPTHPGKSDTRGV